MLSFPVVGFDISGVKPSSAITTVSYHNNVAVAYTKIVSQHSILWRKWENIMWVFRITEFLAEIQTRRGAMNE